MGGGDDEGVFTGAQRVIVEGDEEEHEEHGEEFLELGPADRPEERAPLSEFCCPIILHILAEASPSKFCLLSASHIGILNETVKNGECVKILYCLLNKNFGV